MSLVKSFSWILCIVRIVFTGELSGTPHSKAVLSMHHRLGKPQEVIGTSGDTHRPKIKQPQTLNNRRRTAPILAGKRNSRDKSGKSDQGPLYITIEADGSDIWRLDPVISMLQEGAVGLSLALSQFHHIALTLVLPPNSQQHNGI